MSCYTGVRCPVCTKKFTDNDDVVVCPVCGAPHHRVCYAQKNECAFATEHLSGKEWQPPEEDAPRSGAEQEAPPSTKTCANCGSANNLDGIFCQVCGVRLAGPGSPQNAGPSFSGQGGPYSPPRGTPQGQGVSGIPLDPQVFIYGGINPDEALDGELAKDLAVYLGPNSAYYLPRFARISKQSAPISMNLSALFLSFFYYFYRKMYLIGGILLGLFILCLIPYCLYIREMLPDLMKQPEFIALIDRTGVILSLPTVEVDAAAAALFARLSNIAWLAFSLAGIGLSLFSNSFYYRKAVGDVRKVRLYFADQADRNQYHLSLACQGGVSALSVVMAVGVAFLSYSMSATFAFRGIFM